MRTIILGGVLLITLVLQVTVLPHLPLFGIWPDLFLLLTIAFSLLCGSGEGKWFGLAAGLISDLFLGRWFGVQALLKMLVGYSVGWFAGKFFVDHLGVPIVMTVICVTLQELLLYLMARSSGGLPWQLGWFFSSVWPWVLVYSVVLTPLVYKAMLRVNPSGRRLDLSSDRLRSPRR